MSKTRADNSECKSGLDLTGMDRKVRPEDDLFRFANGTWLDNTKIPPDRASWGVISELQERAERNQRAAIEALDRRAERASGAAQIRDIYSSFMNLDGRSDDGATAVMPLLTAIDAAQTISDCDRLLGRFVRLGIGGLLSVFIAPDREQPDRYRVYLGQGGLTLPSRDYYLEESERYAKLRQGLAVYASKLAVAAGRRDQSYGHGWRLAELEAQFAAIHWPPEDTRDVTKTTNVMSIDQLRTVSPNFDWHAFFDELGGRNIGDIIVLQPSYVEAFANIIPNMIAAEFEAIAEHLENQPKELIDDLHQKSVLNRYKGYLLHRVLHWAAPLLGSDFESIYFQDFEAPVLGLKQPSPRWQRGIRLVNRYLGEALGQLYVDRHFSEPAAKAADHMIDHIIDAFRTSLTELDWLGESAKIIAQKKLDCLGRKVGRPKTRRDYEHFTAKADDLIASVSKAASFEFDRLMSRLSDPVDRNEWYMPPQTVNAYYNPSLNEIVFPAAFLQPPLFDAEADAAANFGAIGAVVGHELSHGFDDQGRKYGPDGKLNDWWSADDKQAFETRAEKLVEQFSAYAPLSGLHINGRNALGENIADLVGLSMALKAYLKAAGDKHKQVLDGFTGLQRFFLAWAQTWRWIHTDEAMTAMVTSGPHSPPAYRVNGVVTNIDAFYQAFDVQEADRLYRPASQRVRIW